MSFDIPILKLAMWQHVVLCVLSVARRALDCQGTMDPIIIIIIIIIIIYLCMSNTLSFFCTNTLIPGVTMLMGTGINMYPITEHCVCASLTL